MNNGSTRRRGDLGLQLIKCYRNCVPPKRYPGCGAKCEEYKKEKEELKLKREYIRKDREAHPVLTTYDFHKFE